AQARRSGGPAPRGRRAVHGPQIHDENRDPARDAPRSRLLRFRLQAFAEPMKDPRAMTAPVLAPLPHGALDIVGDVHGEVEALEALLGRLGYDRDGVHPD